MGEEQELGVERDAVRPGAVEPLQRGMASEAFQAALSVTERQSKERPDGAVEQPARQATGKRARGGAGIA